MTASESARVDQDNTGLQETDMGVSVLGDGSHVHKSDPRLGALACVDDAGATIGLVIAFGGVLPEEMVSLLSLLQNDLLDVYSDLHTPMGVEDEHQVRITTGYIDRIQALYDAYSDQTAPSASAVIPGGTASAAFLHKARASVRLAEHHVWIALEQNPESMNLLAASYLNRLSALLFVLARTANAEHGDLLWQPGLSERAAQEAQEQQQEAEQA
ncbi:cob(I)yrinic acid a c-diamide adenosyltransferase [Streptomonospora sp. S1-112]|uniref:Corrinoid adenosyltransferase n=1 Tax=Streptomonospora mangrovi TaxID=2883123 RepID=A0A9X3NLD5_9ACTN|nr:cob(I)yrinic acid a c-diamide adenosyltransferase [Streptomonospora mangrovi]MDA0565622.1 cob(I)yrinic acid a c-diamide adenosyltransferase [Streptomonospora mangrovi]